MSSDSRIFFQDNTEILKIDELNSLRNWIISTAENERFSIGELRFVFCSDEFLRNINVKYLEHDTYTDIITFDYGSEDSIQGEIYISIDRVYDNAKMLNQKRHTEIRRIIIHGVLHLCGYKDKSPGDKKRMTAKEDYYLSLLPDSR